MSAKKLYASCTYKRSSMQRVIDDVSHSIAVLRRRFPDGHIFRVEFTPIPGSQYALQDMKVVGKEIRATAPPPVPVAETTEPAQPQRPYHYRRRRRFGQCWADLSEASA